MSVWHFSLDCWFSFTNCSFPCILSDLGLHSTLLAWALYSSLSLNPSTCPVRLMYPEPLKCHLLHCDRSPPGEQCFLQSFVLLFSLVCLVHSVHSPLRRQNDIIKLLSHIFSCSRGNLYNSFLLYCKYKPNFCLYFQGSSELARSSDLITTPLLLLSLT